MTHAARFAFGAALILATGGWAWSGALHAGATTAFVAPRRTYPDIETERLYTAAPLTLAQREAADIAFWEKRAADDPMSADALAHVAALYLQRSRETADFADVRLAEDAARRSLTRRARGNGPSRSILASTLLAQHRFQEALAEATVLAAEAPGTPEYVALRAECEMETGAYDSARASFDTLARLGNTLSAMGRRARWAEVTGDLPGARRMLTAAIVDASTRQELTSEQRAWFELRLGDVEWRMGKRLRARDAYERGLVLRPGDHRLHAALARLDAAEGNWRDALAHGNEVLAVQLDPATLGVMSDAHAALGDTAAAHRAQIAMETAVMGQPGAYHRAWSLFLLDQHRRVDEVAVQARAELRDRQDVYGWDVYAWALHAQGDDVAADSAMARALRVGTRDALLWYHAATIARGVRDDDRAWRLLDSALTLNPRFDHRHAAQARAWHDSLAGGVAPHALHTALARVTVNAEASRVDVSYRVFSDDFATALRQQTPAVKSGADHHVPDEAAVAYAKATLVLRDERQVAIVLSGCGQTYEQDLTIVCLRAPVVRLPSHLNVVHRALTEAFADQVNIVQVVVGGKTTSLLFTRDALGVQRAP